MASKLNWPSPTSRLMCKQADKCHNSQDRDIGGGQLALHRHAHLSEQGGALALVVIMLWLTGSPRVPNDPNKYILYPPALHLSSAAAHSALPVRAFAYAGVDRRRL